MKRSNNPKSSINKIIGINKGGLKVETLKETLKIAKDNEMYDYAYNYIKEKYESIAT